MSIFPQLKVFFSLALALLLIGCTAAPVSPTVTVTLPASAAPLPSATTAATESPQGLKYEQAVAQFEYSSDIPFETKEASQPETEDGLTVSDILYRAHSADYGLQGWTAAYLVRPEGEGPFAGILFMHWLGAGLTRKEFLDEARQLAKRGVVSLLINGYFPWSKQPANPQADHAQVIGQVIELRRALDFLLAQPGVDAQRIAYVGHDYGGLYGGVLSGIEKRLKAYVLMAAPGNFSDWSINYFLPSSVDKTRYRQEMSAVDPIFYVPHAAPAAILFQFANNDIYVSKPEAQKLFNAASEPKEIKWYETGHKLNAAAQSDRLAWLASQLNLPATP